MTRYSQALMDAAAEVAAETGEDVEALRRALAEQAATAYTMIRRFLAVAEGSDFDARCPQSVARCYRRSRSLS